MIGDDVEIIIVDVRGDKVRLGITAPKEIPVHRREIYDAIQREKAEKKQAPEPVNDELKIKQEKPKAEQDEPKDKLKEKPKAEQKEEPKADEQQESTKQPSE